MAGTAVRYDGPHARVALPVETDKGTKTEVVERGKSVTVPQKLADELVSRADWSKPAAEKQQATAEKREEK